MYSIGRVRRADVGLFLDTEPLSAQHPPQHASRYGLPSRAHPGGKHAFPPAAGPDVPAATACVRERGAAELRAGGGDGARGPDAAQPRAKRVQAQAAQPLASLRLRRRRLVLTDGELLS